MTNSTVFTLVLIVLFFVLFIILIAYTLRIKGKEKRIYENELDNLQPLWSKDNLKKGSKMFYSLEQ